MSIIQSQCEMMLNHMREHGSITSREAMYDYGIGRASGRVFDLRKRGYDVETTMETGLNRYGIPTRYARYTLAEREGINEAKNDQSRNSGSA